MEGQQREREGRRHHQLDVSRPCEEERAEGEQDRCYQRSGKIPGQPASEQIHPDHRKRETDEDGRIVRRIRVLGEDVGRQRDDPGTDVGFGERERHLVRVEDVGVEHVLAGRQGMGHPRDVPDAELAIARCQPSKFARPE